MTVVRGLVGMFCLLLLAFALSETRRAIRIRIVVAGVMLQIMLAVLLLEVPSLQRCGRAGAWCRRRYVITKILSCPSTTARNSEWQSIGYS